MSWLIWKNLFGFQFIFVVSIVLILIILWVKSRKKQETTCQIPRILTIPIFKCIVSIMRKNEDNRIGVYLLQYMSSFCQLFKKNGIFKFIWGGYTYVVLFHPETAQEVLKSYTVINKDWVYNIFHPWLGTGLLTSSDEKWRKRRKLLTPSFHFRILEDFQEIFHEQSTILVEKLKRGKKDETVDMFELVTLCTLDIIGDSAMGIHLKAQVHSDDIYVKAVKDITVSIIEFVAKPWYWFPPILHFSSLGRKMKADIKILHDFTIKVIRKRKQKIIEEKEENENIDDFQEDKEISGIKRRRAFLDLLLYHHLTDASLTEEDIREEVDTFMFEGHDTTAMGISWTLYLLGLHQDIQERVFQELQGVFSQDMNRSIKTEDLKEMKYLERVIKESLRLYPSVPYIIRRSTEELKIGKYTIPRNSSIFVYIHGIHHNSEIYENPEVFDPDRFLQKNCESRHPFAYIPFSAGPRNCIGQRFAMNVLKTVCANVLRNFKVHSIPQRDEVLVAGDIILRPKEEVKMLVEIR